MWKMQPKKWLLYSGVAFLPLIAAGWFNTGTLNTKISDDVSAHLAAVGADWAKPSFDGRDVKLGGDAPSEEAVTAAESAILRSYGVRTLTTATRVVPPLPPVAPTIDSIVTNVATPEIKGTWAEGVAKTLAVTLAGKVYNLGASPELTSAAGAWVLKLAAPLADGTYDVTAEVSDGVNPPVGTAAPGKIVVDTVAPTLPMVTPIATGTVWPFTLTGTWPEGDAISLVAKLADKIWTLGKDEALKSDGKGNWSFAPAIELNPGSYDVTLEAADAAGNVTVMKAPAAIVVAEKIVEPVAAPVPEPSTPVVIVKPLASPTVTLIASDVSPASISGMWPEGDAKTLKVSVPKAGVDASLGVAGSALVSDGAGKWTLAIAAVLTPGSYDVVVEASDGAARTSSDQTKFEVFIKEPVAAVAEPAPVAPVTPPPAPAPTPIPAAPAVVDLVAPTVTVFAGEQAPTVLSGTWDEAHAKGLKVSIPGANVSATLNTDAALTSTNGAWSLALAKPFDPGIYNVIVEETDAAGKVVTDQTTAEIYVKAPPPPPPPPLPPPYDCAGVLAKIATVFPIRFEFKHTRIVSPYDVALMQYAALLKDPRCVTLKAEIAGHADDYGPRLFNQLLSELRAQSVAAALTAAGVDAGRLSTEGFSESEPLDPEKTHQARLKNRRVEITLLK